MSTEIDQLLRRMIGGSDHATREVRSRAEASTSPEVLVAAAVVSSDADLLGRARMVAVTTRDRQLVALAEAYVRGDVDLFHVLVRDHLSDHPDNLVAAWIAGLDAVMKSHRKEDPSC